MKIKFLPFINDDTGKNWRTKREKAFLTNQGLLVTNEINEIRNNHGNTTLYPTDNDYYTALHEKKAERQKRWLEILLKETAHLFSEELNKLSAADKDKDKTTIVAALPEFFWYDINDNDKHKNTEKIVNYHKPIYAANLINYLLGHENPLVKLTTDYPNLIFFAGTAIWKYLDPENKENIYNTLMIFGGGKLLKVWTKVSVSTIDGFYDWSKSKVVVAKDKIGHGTTNDIPAVSFNGKTFVFDICLDFSLKPGEPPLSSKLFSGNSDVNLLISAGMPVDSTKLNLINSPLMFRCDGLWEPYGEILIKNSGTVRTSSGTKKIDCLEIDI